jgi:hypothetical protein
MQNRGWVMMTMEMGRRHVKDEDGRECHRNRFDVRTIKAVKSGTTVGISVRAEINDNHNAIYGNNNAGYGEEAGHKDRAYQGQ